jgi:hypothetical protein
MAQAKRPPVQSESEVWGHIFEACPDAPRVIAEFATEKSVPDNQKFLVMLVHTEPPCPLEISWLLVRDYSAAAAERNTLSAARSEGSTPWRGSSAPSPAQRRATEPAAVQVGPTEQAPWQKKSEWNLGNGNEHRPRA